MVLGSVFSCGADLSGKSASKAKVTISFFPPVEMTFGRSLAARNRRIRAAGGRQASSPAEASRNMNNAINEAIKAALKENQISLLAAASVEISYTPPQFPLSSSGKCEKAGDFIAEDGVILYECEEDGPGGPGSTASPGTKTTPSDGSTSSPTTELTTETISTSTLTPDLPKLKKRFRPKRSLGEHPIPDQVVSLVADAHQILYEAQWKNIARSAEKYLEAKRFIFTDDIKIDLQ
ncbi:unnamed protein product [Caenorhabditis auriculariae]|uniref:Uncharacterized protein n=1 Tax=Caenorhabditis auriculariae TaxID=2777116 RepID=A0A8S1HA70_9PELO|nr:unnamed protein product [Caenorhabditis auriculariae]